MLQSPMLWLLLLPLAWLIWSGARMAMDEDIEWEQVFHWGPTWPYGFPAPEPHVDPDAISHHLFENASADGMATSETRPKD